MTTIHSLLSTAGQQLTAISDSPTLDAEILLSFILQKDRSHLTAWPEKELAEGHCQRFKTLVNKRYAGQPIAYLTGTREFWSRPFTVNSDVLIPRPDTELLIELALLALPENKALTILDLGTGSGAIAITLAAERPQLTVTATDASAKALALAKKNAHQLGCTTIEFCHGHWFKPLTGQHYDLIVSNPPYIAPNDPHLTQGDIRFEPQQALIAANQGLADIQTITDHARQHLKAGAPLLIEHGYDQQASVQGIFKRYNYDRIATHNDLAGNPRVTTGVYNT
ncbi:MAG TPA: peptide chain release factor N(5)-glutamine methyltransferase [Methylococcales bacterium]|jgi:release factor glutamine methyltransferase|nr:peptide chain release factor N(5)-glutamine methyltransferase [Methylococcaceae bacterium]HIN68507.1 peptide chain release factor N(5)-glutamine methyltransferase [Methylococcales bacterium]